MSGDGAEVQHPDEVLSRLPTTEAHSVVGVDDAGQPKIKHITMELTWHKAFNAYRVESITDTVYYKPGDFLSEDVVKACNKNPQWSTKAVRSDVLTFLGRILGLAGSVGVKTAL